jgi:hypothetical protein
MGFGLMHFLGNLTMTANSSYEKPSRRRSILQNLPGGFKAKGVRLVGDNEPISPLVNFKEIEATGVDFDKGQLSLLPYKEPSLYFYFRC